MQIGKNIALQNIPVGYFSLEMSGESLGLRTLASISNVSDRALRSGLVKESTAVWQRINDGFSRMYEFPFYVVDRIKGELNEIKALCRQFVRCYGVEVIFIDHISLVKSLNKNIPRYEQYTEISNELQQLQRELKCSIVAVMQLGRGSEGKLPTLADLRESGSFEQDADCIMLLHRERVGEKNEKKQFIDTSLFVAKNRNGACGVAKLEFEPAFVRFRDKRAE